MIIVMTLSYRKLKYQSVICIFRRIESMYNTKTCQNLNNKVGKNATFKTVRAT